MNNDEKALATVELLGALTHGALRAFEITARAARIAPDARRADRIADFAAREHERYVLLRDRLIELTDLGAAVIERQKQLLDEFFDQAPVDGTWQHACTFFATGLPIAEDFVREIAPRIEGDETREILLRALTDRNRFYEFAREQVLDYIDDDAERREEVRALVADVLGRALTGFQSAIADTDALKVLLTDEGADEPAESEVRHLAVRVLEGHRRRMLELGIDSLD